MTSLGCHRFVASALLAALVLAGVPGSSLHRGAPPRRRSWPAALLLAAIGTAAGAVRARR